MGQPDGPERRWSVSRCPRRRPRSDSSRPWRRMEPLGTDEPRHRNSRAQLDIENGLCLRLGILKKIRTLRNSVMTRSQAEQMADSLRAAGWPVAYVEINDDGTWRAMAEACQVPARWRSRRR